MPGLPGHTYYYTGLARTILTCVTGRSFASVCTFPSRFTTSMPLATRPKIVCFPAGRRYSGGTKTETLRMQEDEKRRQTVRNEAPLTLPYYLATLTVQPRRRRQRYEELRPVGVRA